MKSFREDNQLQPELPQFKSRKEQIEVFRMLQQKLVERKQRSKLFQEASKSS